MQSLVVKAVSLAIARDGASGGVVRTVTVSPFYILLICISVNSWCICFDMQINADGVTRKFYPGDSLPLWHDEVVAHNSFLDILAGSSSPEPMSTWIFSPWMLSLGIRLSFWCSICHRLNIPKSRVFTSLLWSFLNILCFIISFSV